MAKSKVELKVTGMTCQGCVRSIEGKLSSLTGVDYAHVNLGAGTAAVEFDDLRIQPPAMIAAIEQLGFAVTQPA